MAKNTATLFFACVSFVLVIPGCESNRSDPRVQTTVQVVEGHTHALIVRYRDVENGREDYVLEESAGHSHAMNLDAEHRALLLLRIPVTAASSQAKNHSHSVSLSVADD